MSTSRARDPYADVRQPDPVRFALSRSVYTPASIDTVAEAIAAASELPGAFLVERLPGGWRWSPAHTGGPYPLLRITARFLHMDYAALMVQAGGVEGRSVLIRPNMERRGRCAFLRLTEPANAEAVRARMIELLPDQSAPVEPAST